MGLFFQLLVNGIGRGSVYALVGFGIAFAFQATKVTNFIVGPLLVGGGLAAATLAPYVGTAWAVVISITGGAVLGVLLYYVVLRRLTSMEELAAVQTTVALALALEGVALLVFGPNAHTMDPVIPTRTFSPGLNVTVSTDMLILVGAAIVAFFVLNTLLLHSHFGRALRAVSEDPDTAGSLGLNVGRVALATYALLGALCWYSGAVLIPTSPLSINQDFPLLVGTLIAATIGGLSRPIGVATGGLIVGVVQSLSIGYLNEFYQSIVLLLTVAAILTARPGGLFEGLRGRTVA